MSERVKPRDAAKEIGCAEQYMRERMRDKKNPWDLGEVVRPENGRKNFRYYIFRSKLDAFLGKKINKSN